MMTSAEVESYSLEVSTAVLILFNQSINVILLLSEK